MPKPSKHSAKKAVEPLDAWAVLFMGDYVGIHIRKKDAIHFWKQAMLKTKNGEVIPVKIVPVRRGK